MKAGVASLMLVAAALPSAALAQHTGSRIPGARTAMVARVGDDDVQKLTVSSGDEAIRYTRTMAGCLLEKASPGVVEYLNGYASRPELPPALQTKLPACFERVALAGQMKLSRTLFHEALSEAVLSAKANVAAPADSELAAGTWMTSNVPHRVVQEMAACLVERDGATATALVKSEPASAQEAAAFQTLMPSISPCLIRGTTLTSSRAGLRLALAAAVYYQNLSTPSASAAVSEKK